MNKAEAFDIFLVSTPGLERALAEEARDRGFKTIRTENGGVTIRGVWTDVWRAHLVLRGASRVLARIGSFRAMHLSQLDKRARKFPWAATLRRDVPVAVEASCTRSKIYHSGAAAQRIATAIREELGAPGSDAANVVVKARLDEDICTISIDASGDMLHKRGHKEAIGKAPMRETMAALFLHQCGFTGNEPVVDPMCGSGTFVIEAAEIAMGLAPGRSRRFAFEQLANFDAEAWTRMKDEVKGREASFTYHGFDRDEGAIRSSRANARRAGVSEVTAFTRQAISDLIAPEGPAGLVIINPPYGDRIGDKAALLDLYATLGQRLRAGFSGWRVGLITNEEALARATGLPFLPAERTVSHGGLKVRLYRSEPLA